MIKTTLRVDDDGVLTFPDEMMEKLGWKEGDTLEWIDNKDGSWSLVKCEDEWYHPQSAVAINKKCIK